MSDAPERGVTRKELDEAVDGLRLELNTLVAAVEEALGARSKGDNPDVGQWRWATISPDRRRELWGELREFVRWYNDRLGTHDDSLHIYPCWIHHPVVVEMLTAQMVAWKAAHAAKVPTEQLRLWFEHLWPVVDRIKKEAGGMKQCSPRTHHPINVVEVEHVGDAAFTAHVEEDVRGHSPEPDSATA